MDRVTKITHAPWWMTFVSIFWWVWDADGLFAKLSTYGGIVAFRFLFRRGLLVNDPEVVKRILIGELSQHYGVVSDGLGLLGLLIGKEGVLVLPSGEQHKEARRFLAGALHGTGLSQSYQIMWQEAHQTTRQLTELAEQKRVFDMSDVMANFAMQIISQAVFGAKLTPQMIHETRVAIEGGLEKLFPRMQIPVGIPLMWTRFKGHAHALERIVEEMIERREVANDWAEATDTLSELLRLEKKGVITRQTTKDNLRTLFVAGHETTASALTVLWEMLSRHPEFYDWIETEARSQQTALTQADRSRLPRIWALIDESMRLAPITPRTGRMTLTRHELLSETIHPGTVAFFSNLDRQRDPMLWGADAAEFRPGRFIEEDGVDRRRLKMAFTPFGGGDRLCLGAAFAVGEMASLIVAVMHAGLRFTVAPGFESTIVCGITRKFHRLDMLAHLVAPS